MAPAAGQAKLPVFVRVNGTVWSEPVAASAESCGWYIAAKIFVQHTTAWAFPVATAIVLNQLTPSCTRSNAMRYVPASGGGGTVACSVTLWPGPRSAGSFVRAPSQSTVLPVAS